MSDKPRVVLIDLSSLFWTAWMVNNENGLQQARSITLANVKRCEGEDAPLVAICCDSGKSFRKELSPDYKANREKQPPAAYGELDKTKERLIADGYLLWGAEGFEADDVIATAAKAALDRGHEVRICSADKDMLQLLNVKTDCLRTHTWAVVQPKDVLEKFRVEPEQFRDFLALWGDSSDNVPGCAGIGQGRAADLLTQFENIDRIYEAVDAGKDVPHMAKLRAGRDAVMLSRSLVTLRFDVPLNFDEIYNERKVTPLTQASDLPPEKDGDPTDESEAIHNAPVASEGAAEKSTPNPGVISTGDDARPVTAVAQYVAPAVEYERQLEPRSLRAAVWLGQHLFSSRLYTRFPTSEAITAVIIRGREMGLGATTALDTFHVIEGRPVPHAYLMIARAKADPDCEYLQCVETTDETATWETKNRRNPRITTLTYTLAQARASGLVIDSRERTDRDGKKYMSKPNQWVVRPAEMVRKTCGVQLARMEYPAAVMGLYAYEELVGDE